MFSHARLLLLKSNNNILQHSFLLLPFSTCPSFSSTQSQIQESLPQTKQTHANSVIKGLLPQSVSTCASLILNYASFQDPNSARILFHNTIQYCHTAFLWNTLIRAYNILRIPDGFQIYNLMIRNGVNPDDHTFPFVLKACFDYSEVWKGREVHGLVFKIGFDRDVYVGNTLLLFYGGCWDLRDAVKVFDEMSERDIVSWNTVIGVFSANGCFFDALDLFREMRLSPGIGPNLVTVVSVLPVCAELVDEVTTSMIHCYVVKIGFDCHVTTRNALVHAYGKCRSVKAAKQVFDEMTERNHVSWNAVITACSLTGHKRDALNLFHLMMGANVKPDSVTVPSVLSVLVELECFTMAKELHAYSLRVDMESDIFIANSLIDMYAKSGHSLKAWYVFNKMKTRNVVSWNTMVANYAQNGLELEAIGLVRQMQSHNEIPNSVTFTNILPACARTGSLRPGKEIHGRSIRMGSQFELFVSNALIDMYAKCGSLPLARKVFNLSARDEISYNTLISGYSQTTECLESLYLFSEMGLMGMKYDAISFVGVLSACANVSTLKHGKEIHGVLVRKLFHTHLFVVNSLLDVYTKSGRIDLAKRIFDRMLDRDSASWNTMIMGYAMLGELDTSFDLFEAMKKDGIQPDSVSYIAVLSACSHSGLVQKGRKYFDEMGDNDIKKTQTHYACMVDILGRAGLIEEAVEIIKNLPMEADANIWGSLLGACRMHGKIDLGKLAAKHLFKLKPDHSGYYVLLSNMYAEAGRWDEADRIRVLMKSKGVKKNPAYSWVELGDNMNSGFVVGQNVQGLESIF